MSGLYRRELRGDWSGHPVGGEAEVGEDHLRRVVGGKAGDVAAGMAAGAAEIKASQVRAVIAGARERAVIADLVVSKRADEEIAVAHVGEIARDVERRARKRIDDRVGEVGRVLLPELEHGAAVLLAQALPIARVVRAHGKAASPT